MKPYRPTNDRDSLKDRDDFEAFLQRVQRNNEARDASVQTGLYELAVDDYMLLTRIFFDEATSVVVAAERATSVKAIHAGVRTALRHLRTSTAQDGSPLDLLEIRASLKRLAALYRQPEPDVNLGGIRPIYEDLLSGDDESTTLRLVKDLPRIPQPPSELVRLSIPRRRAARTRLRTVECNDLDGVTLQWTDHGTMVNLLVIGEKSSLAERTLFIRYIRDDDVQYEGTCRLEKRPSGTVRATLRNLPFRVNDLAHVFVGWVD